jgi:hypothetical protein
MRSGRGSSVLLPAILLLAATATGQIPSPTGNVFGQVSDEQGRSISGVTVTLTGPGAAQGVATNSNGDFHFLNLSPGEYSITLERSGFATARRNVSVSLGKNVVLSIAMVVAEATEAATVQAESIAVDSRQTETGASFDRKELDGIPTTRDPWAVLRQVPGVLLATVDTGGAHNGQQPTFVGKGAQADQNTYNLDGVGISINGFTPVYFDFDSLAGMEVVTGGSDPALSTAGVTLNLVTKRGTNQLHGSGRGLYTDGARWDYGAEVGGPLWKDHLWLWAAGASNSYLGETFYLPPPDGEAVQSQETQDYWNAKLNAQLAASNTLTLSYLKWERVGAGRGADSGYRSQASTWDDRFPGQSYRFEDSHVFSANLFASLELSYLPAHLMNTPTGGLDTQAFQDANQIWRNSFWDYDVKGEQRQAGVTASTFFDTGNLRHELKFGFGYRQALWDSSTVWPADQLVGYQSFNPPLAGIARASNADLLLRYYDTYLADTIQAGNLTVNLGARFDYQQGKNLASSVPANPVFPDQLPAVHYGGDSGYPITWRTVQPRIGATYAIGKERRTLLRASYARFSNQLGLEVRSVNAFPGAAQLGYYWTDTNANGRVEPGEIDISGGVKGSENVNPYDRGSAVPTNQISPSLEPPTTNEFIVGIEHQILPEVSASVAYTYRSLNNPLFSPIIGTTRASYQYIGNAAGTAVAGDGFALSFSEPYYGLVDCPAPCAGTVLQNRPDTRQTYSGVELQLIKNLSHGWMARVSFAYNDWQQHIGPGAIVDPNNETPGTNASGPFVDGGSPGNGNGGSSIVNATWQFNVGGMVELPLGIQAGLNLFGRQGFPIPYFVEVATNDKWLNPPDIQIGQATDYRLPNVYVLDLQLSKTFLIGGTVAVAPVIACFNVLNSQTVLARNGGVGTYDPRNSPAFTPDTDQFNRVFETLSGRTIRGGVRISF